MMDLFEEGLHLNAENSKLKKHIHNLDPDHKSGA
jgi:hypothetical protein